VPELPLLELPPLDAAPAPEVTLLGAGLVPPPDVLLDPLLPDVPPDVAPDDPPLVGPLVDAALPVPPFVGAVPPDAEPVPLGSLLPAEGPPVSSVANIGDAGLSVLED
jgi:hypothetical protein